MLVRIKPKDVAIGMFIHAFDGSWFDHPFWRSQFRVDTFEQLRRIRDSGLDGLIEAHLTETGSPRAAEILRHWAGELPKFRQIVPKEMLSRLAHPLTDAPSVATA